jgi:DNA polymerase-3 subunit delta
VISSKPVALILWKAYSNFPHSRRAQRSQQSIKIDLATYHKLSNLLIDAEYRLKKAGNVEKTSYLLSSLIKLQSSL